MRNTLKASLAIFLALGAGSAMAQSAPTLSGQTFAQSNEVRNARAEASNTAIQGEQIRLQREALEAQQLQAFALQTLAEQQQQQLELQAQQQAQQARESEQPFQFETGPDGQMRFVLPSGSGLVPVSYVVNIQNGDGNVASNQLVETDVSGSVTEVAQGKPVEN